MQSGSILYTPPAAFSGSDTFSVTLTDALGATASGAVTVTVGTDSNSGGQGLNPPQLTMLPGGHVGIAFQGGGPAVSDPPLRQLGRLDHHRHRDSGGEWRGGVHR